LDQSLGAWAECRRRLLLFIAQRRRLRLTSQPTKGKPTMSDAAKIAELEKQVRFLRQKLDETRRAFGMSSIIDEQLVAINARKDALARG